MLGMKESPSFTRTYDLLCWLLPVTVKFPRQQRFVLAEAVQRTALHLHEQLIEAAYSSAPEQALQVADVTLAKLRFYLRLCRDMELMSTGQYAHVARMVTEIGRLLGGWIKSKGHRLRKVCVLRDGVRPPAWCGAVPGTTIRGTPAAPPVAGAFQRTSTPVWGCGWSCL